MTTPGPVSYAEFYRVATNDPHEGDPSAVYADETPVGVGRNSPATIVTTACGDSNPDAYLLFVKRPGVGVAPCTHVLLQATVCPRSRGRAASRFAGAAIAQYEDVRLLGPTFVRLPAQAFHIRKAVTPTSAEMAPAYAAAGAGAEKLLGPYLAGTANTEEVEVRSMVHLPYRFVPLVLDQLLTPRAAWTVLAGAILAEGADAAAKCAPLLTFLRAASVENSSVPFGTGDVEVVLPDSALEAQRMEILKRDLPARFGDGASGGPAPGDAMTLALTAFEARTEMMERTRLADSAASKAPKTKTPDERWGAVLEGALRIHGCVDASGLPPVYAALAATPKGGERSALQGLYQTRANAKGAATSIPPVCLPSTKDSFMACRHHATNSSDLESGISLPQVSVMTAMQTQELFAVLRDFDLADSRRGLSVDEAAALRAKLGLRFPESGTECCLQSQMFSVMEDVHKGVDHPLSDTIRNDWCPALLAACPKIMEETPRKPMLPAQIMLAFHYMWFDWHDMVTKIQVPSASGITKVPPPDFCIILQNIRFGVFTMLPEYPLRYCRPSTVTKGKSVGGGGGGAYESSCEEAPAQSTRRTKKKPGTPAGQPTGGGAGMWNPAPAGEVDETLCCKAANGDKVRVRQMFSLVGGPPPLRVSDGLATCWAYHSQGGCSSNCDRAFDHCPSSAEDIGPRREYAARVRSKL